MTWNWNKVVMLNKLICEASNQPHAIRTEPIWKDNPLYSASPDEIANEHYFIEGNKRTATCIAVCNALKGV